MTKPVFYLSRQASRALREIYTTSVHQWGAAVADRYVAELYVALRKIATDPSLGEVRKKRSSPFLMAPAGKHFVVYDRWKQSIVIVALLHQRQNIELIIADGGAVFLAEIEAIKKNIKTV